jgi:DNA-directed RNA polymerase subunit RPC12/RpoP
MRHYANRGSASVAVKNKTICATCSAAVRVDGYDHDNEFYNIWRAADGKWVSPCPDCGVERLFKARRHALASARNGSRCRPCSSKEHRKRPHINGFRPGDITRFRDGAAARGYEFALTVENVSEMWDKQGGRCAISGIEMCKRPRTWSLDRKDNSLGYTMENVWLVEKRLNIMRNVFDVDEFIRLCEAVVEWNGDRKLG